MTTKEYVKKYSLDKSNKFNHKEFIADFTNEFITLLQVGNSSKSFKGYENSVRAIKMKWDAISNKTVMGGLPEKLWGFFYATVIAKMKEELFPEEVARLNKMKEDKRKEWEERKRMREQDAESFWDRMFAGFLFDMLRSERKPVAEYAVLGLPEDATAEQVTLQYRTLAMKYHPDRGGKQEDFVKITEAKNKLLAYLS